MFIMIIGGKIGFYLARALLREGHEIIVIDQDANRCRYIEEELGRICLAGNGWEVATLSHAGAERADMFIAVVDEDKDNLVACQLAKYQFGVRRTIARVSNPENQALFKKLGVDVTVSSTSLILENIEEKVPTHPLTHIHQFEDTGTEITEIIEIKLLPDSEAVGKRIADLSLPQEVILCLLVRRNQPPQVPTPDTILEAEDRILVALPSTEEEKVRLALLGTPEESPDA